MKFAFVTPRYGAEIAAGPEHACRLLAERVGERHHVEVLTTCAGSPLTWRNEHAEGFDRIRGALVRRFAVSQPHDSIAFEHLSARLRAAGSGHGRQDEVEWVRRLGPVTPGLLDHLKRQHRTYDAVVFFSLFHWTTVEGLPVVGGRGILFPHLTQQPALRLGLWSELTASARALGFVSASERKIASAYLGRALPPDEVVGTGVDAAPQQTYPRHQQDPADDPASDDEDRDDVNGRGAASPDASERGVLFRRRQRIHGPFVVHGERVTGNNGSEEMLEYFDACAGSLGDTVLMLMGPKLMHVPEIPHVRMAGALPDRERLAAYEAADVTLAPDPDDLLARTVLESFAVGTPVLATAGNASAVDHCRRSNGGLYYQSREEFGEALRLLTADARLRARLGENARQYVRQHHRWDAVLGRFDRLVGRARG